MSAKVGKRISTSELSGVALNAQHQEMEKIREKRAQLQVEDSLGNR